MKRMNNDEINSIPKGKDKSIRDLINPNSNKIISKVRIADSFKSRLLGLMFKKDIDLPLLFIIPDKIDSRSRSSIHTCFMRFELTLVFIDKNDTIFEIVDLKPWKYHSPKKSSKYIIEFKKESFNKYDLKIGDKIELK